MKKVFYIIYQTLIALPILLVATLLTAIITIVGCYVGDSRFWGYYPGRWWSRIVCAVLLIRVKVIGSELIDPKQSYIFVANHQGAFDIFLIYGFLGHNFKWIMKKGLRSIPFVGKACAAAGHIYIDDNGGRSVKSSLEAARDQLTHGMSVVIFPEGARTFTGKMGRFKRGAFQLASDLNLPIVPLTINGSFKLMSRTSFIVTHSNMSLTIHPTIYPENTNNDNINHCTSTAHSVIESALNLS